MPIEGMRRAPPPSSRAGIDKARRDLPAGESYPRIARACRELSRRDVACDQQGAGGRSPGGRWSARPSRWSRCWRALPEQVADRGHVNRLAFPLFGIVVWNSGWSTSRCRSRRWRSPGACAGWWLQAALLMTGVARLVGGAARSGRDRRRFCRRLEPAGRVAGAAHAPRACLHLATRRCSRSARSPGSTCAGWCSTIASAGRALSSRRRRCTRCSRRCSDRRPRCSAMPFPDVESIVAPLRFAANGAAGAGAGGGAWTRAAPVQGQRGGRDLDHLHALTVALVVILPRLLLASVAGLREARLARRPPLDRRRRTSGGALSLPRRFAAGCACCPYSYATDDRAREGLSTLARTLLGDAAQVEVLRAVARRGGSRRRRAPGPGRRLRLAGDRTVQSRGDARGREPRLLPRGAARCRWRTARGAGGHRTLRAPPRARGWRARLEERCRTWRAFVARARPCAVPASTRRRAADRRAGARTRSGARGAVVVNVDRAGLAHQRRQDHAGAHAARPRRRRVRDAGARHRAGRTPRAARARRWQPAAALGHAGLRRLDAPAGAAAARGQPDRLAAARGLGSLARPAVLVQPAGGARGARVRGRRAVPGQCRRGPEREATASPPSCRCCAGWGGRSSCC